MSLSNYALITPDEIKEALSLQGTGMDTMLEGIANRVSDVIESYLRRQIVSRGTLTEYHTVDSYWSDLYLTQYPVLAITTVKEGAWSGGTWVASATLVSGTDYIVDKPCGRLIRLSGGSAGVWLVGVEKLQIVYTAGVASTGSVPGIIKDVALRVAGRQFQEIKRGGDGVQQVNDGMGFVTRFMPSELLRIEKEQLAAVARWEVSSTGRVA